MSSRLLSRAGVVVAAASMVVGSCVVAASPAVAADAPAPLASYDFSRTPDDLKTVVNSAPGALGPAVVQNSTAELWKDSALTLTGGAKTSTGPWVRLPDDILAGKKSATVQMEVRADASMLNNFHFLWNVGNDSSSTEYFFASLNCGNNRQPLVGVKAGGKERLVSAQSCGVQANRWMSVSAVIDGSGKPVTASLYVDGARVATGEVASTPADIVSQSLNTIGRSPWPDALFAGAVSTFRVFDTALTADQVKALSDTDGSLHRDSHRGAAEALLTDVNLPATVDAPHIGLPTGGGSVTWTTSDKSVISERGEVTQPAKGSDPVDVTLTAHTSVRGQTAQRVFVVKVLPSQKSEDQVLQEIARAYVVPSVVRAGATLPAAPDGVTVTLKGTDGVSVTAERLVSGTGTTEVSGRVEATLGRGSARLVKTFPVTVLPAEGSEDLLGYHRRPTTEMVANNGDIAYSMHLALGHDDGTWSPLNENYGVFFARTNQTPTNAVDVRLGSHRSLKDPSLFRLADGSFGVVAVRTERGSDKVDAQARNKVLFARSQDLLAYDEAPNSRSLIDVGETNGVNRPYAVHDASSNRYVVGWTDDSGVARFTTFEDITQDAPAHGDVLHGTVPTMGEVPEASGVDDYVAGRAIPVTSAQAKALTGRLGRITQTGWEAPGAVHVDEGAAPETLDLPGRVTMTYSDGSRNDLPVESWDTTGVDLSTPGTYKAVGKIKQTTYPLPFAEDRADPSVYKWDWVKDGVTRTKYLMIASNDIDGDVVWQKGTPHMPVRMGDTIAELADTPWDPSGLIGKDGFNPKESILLEKNDLDADGKPMTSSFWAPEFHEINGTLSILFMPAYNNDWAKGASSAVMQLKKDAAGEDMDPTRRESWTAPRTVSRADGTPLSMRADGTQGMSLDMTYFQDESGKSYYAWQQLGAVYLARMDPANPFRVTSDPVLVVSPEYAWDNAIAEGPNVVNHEGKLYLIYSGSSVGRSYTTGLAMADASGTTDLTDPASWKKLNYPIQKSGIFNGEWQLGTGHGMWSEDEDGQMIYVFHAYANRTPGYSNVGGRDMFIRRVHWAADGLPVFDMDLAEEVTPGTTVTVDVVVSHEDTGGPGTDPGEEPGENPGSGGQPGGTPQPGGNGGGVPTPKASAPASATPARKGLAVTGADLAGLLAGVLVLGVGGTVAVRSAARRR